MAFSISTFLKHIILLSVRVLYLDGVIQFQQEYFFIHNSHVQEWLSWQASVRFIDSLSEASDRNPIRNVWSEVKKLYRKPGLTFLQEI
jgi:hypothetical protein